MLDRPLALCSPLVDMPDGSEMPPELYELVDL